MKTFEKKSQIVDLVRSAKSSQVRSFTAQQLKELDLETSQSFDVIGYTKLSFVNGRMTQDENGKAYFFLKSGELTVRMNASQITESSIVGTDKAPKVEGFIHLHSSEIDGKVAKWCSIERSKQAKKDREIQIAVFEEEEN